VVRLALIVLLQGGVGVALWQFGSFLSPGHYLVIAGADLLVSSLVLTAGQVKLFGPVFFFDAVRSARRGWHLVFRCLLLAALLLVLLVLYAMQFRGLSGLLQPATLPPNEMARFAQRFFELLTTVQIVAVMALTPVYAAGAISEEREKKTLDFLFATSLANHE